MCTAIVRPGVCFGATLMAADWLALFGRVDVMVADCLFGGVYNVCVCGCMYVFVDGAGGVCLFGSERIV